MTLALPDVATDQLSLEARFSDGVVTVRIAGTADLAGRAQLDDYIQRLHAEAVRLRVSSVSVDMRSLEFMNSSCLKVFVSWLAQLRDLQGNGQYKVRIQSNPELLWQRRSLAALSCFAIDLVSVEP
jgi:anti-anti-sigma factor